MKRLLLPSLLVSSLVLFTLGCGEKPVVTDAPPAPVPLKPKPKIYRAEDGKAAEAAREAAIAREIAELEAEAEKLRQEIAQEQLAVDRAALEEEQRRLDQERAAWLNEQVAAAVPAQPKTPVSTPVVLPPARDYSLFYTELAVHGSWFQSVDYGYVWQPAVALQTSWRPYTVGRWAACDRGWTWLSDEPFGWATYHYGRWAKMKGCGWIWVPGEVWAPAWVAWRRSDQYVGWCPLPPETLYRDEVTYDSSIDKLCGIQPSSYTFIAVKHFCLPVHRHCEPPERSGVVCRDTTNITRLSVSRHRVNGSGPKYEWIRDRHPHPPDRYILASDPLTKGDRKFRIDRDKLCVFSPVMRAPWNAALRPREVAGPLPEGAVVPRGTVPTDKILRRFREDKKHWMEAGTKALQGESARHLTERQDRVEALTAAVQNPPKPRQTTPRGQPAEQNLTPSRPGVTPPRVLAESSLAKRRAQREQVRKEVSARQAELSQLRGLPVAAETAPSRIVSGGRPAVPAVVTPGARPQPGAGDQILARVPGRLPEVATPRPRVEPVEIPRLVESQPVIPPGTVETTVASTPGQETPGLGAAGTIAEVPPVHSEVTAPEVLVRREAQTDLEARREEVARLKETLTVRQQQKMGPQPQGDPSLNGSGQSGASGQLVRRVQETGPVPAAEPAGQSPPVQVAGPQAPAGVTGPLPEESAARRDAAVGLAERREKAARINGELAARQQELQQQREARQQAQAEREHALAQSAAEADRQRETAQAAQMALAAEQQQNQQEQQRQLAAEAAARQQELAGEAARQQQQAQLAAQAEAAREQQQQRETEANRQRQATERAQQEQAAREQAQRQAEERARQEEMARQHREAAERAQQEQAAREQAQRQAEERARQEEMARQQREAAERAQQEQAVREQAQRQAEERARQEEMARQQREAAERAQQEQAAREQAQRQAEERARQEQAARDQAAREQAQRQAEEAARAAAEAAKNGNK